jgi:hypothetical protein
MYTQSTITHRLFTIVCITVFALTSLPLATDSFAGERDRGSQRLSRQRERVEVRPQRRVRKEVRRHIISPRVIRHGHVVQSLPRGYKRIWYRREPYYFFGGVFYRPTLSGFVVVKAPVGAIVISLPVGYQRLWYDDTVYYIYDGTFYRQIPAGYIVVEPPPALIVEDGGPELVQPLEKGSGKVSVTAPILNVRSGPAMHYPKIYQVERGYILEVMGKSDGWLYVQLPNGEFGWVMAEFTLRLETGSG